MLFTTYFKSIGINGVIPKIKHLSNLFWSNVEARGTKIERGGNMIHMQAA